MASKVEKRITAARTTSDRSAAGFTLLEIVIVLLVVGVVIGGAFGLMVASSDERALNRSQVEIEVLAKRARAIASLQQRPYALEFSEQSVRMMPLAEAMVDPDSRDGSSRRQGDGVIGVDSRFDAMYAFWTIDEEMRMFVRRWASDRWVPSDSKTRHIWRFDPDGICEPIGVRLEYRRSWVESIFHPLTAGVRESFSEIY